MKRVLAALDATDRSELVQAVLPRICAPEDEIVLLTVAQIPDPIPGSRDHTWEFAPNKSVAFVSGNLRAVEPEMPSYIETTDQLIGWTEDETGGFLANRAKDLRELGFAPRTQVLLDGDASHALIEYAKEFKPDIIVMAARSRPAVAKMLLGSVTKTVLESGVAPVLVLNAE